MRFILISVFILSLLACKSKKEAVKGDGKQKTQSSEITTPMDAMRPNQKPLDTGNVEIIEATEQNPLKQDPSNQNPPDLPTPGVDQLTGNWKLMTWASEGVFKPIPADWKFGVSYTGQPSTTLGVQGPCNNGGCTIQLSPGNMIIGPECFGTEMYCDQKSEWEELYYQSLKAAISYKTVGGNLVLSGPAVEMTFQRIDE